MTTVDTNGPSYSLLFLRSISHSSGAATVTIVDNSKVIAHTCCYYAIWKILLIKSFFIRMRCKYFGNMNCYHLPGTISGDIH